MNFISWGQAYHIGFDEIDNQHIGLVNIINDLYNSIAANQIEGKLNEILLKLVKYTKVHFTTEETLMVQYNYDEYEQHKEKHQHFIEQVSFFLEEVKLNKKSINIQLLTFLKDWLIEHIAYTDKKFGNFLNKVIPKE